MPPHAVVASLTRLSVRLLVALATVLAVLALSTHRRVLRMADAHPPEGTLVTVDGALVHYVRAGTGPTVLLLHGSPGFTRDWQMTVPGKTSVFDDLARDHTVLALDRPGYGWSESADGRPLTVEAQADVVAGFLNALGIPHATVVGHSYGGGLALATAVGHPGVVAALVHVSGTGYPEDAGPDLLNHIIVAPGAGVVLRWCIAPFLVPEELRAALTAMYAPDPVLEDHATLFAAFLNRPHTLRQHASEMLSSPASRVALSPHYAELTLPVTVLVGAQEVYPSIRNSARRLAEDVAGAKFVEVPDAGHMLPHVRPQVVAAEVRALTAAPPSSPPAEPAAEPAP